MSGDQNPWQVLELAPGADAEAIKRAYRRLAAQHHPDRNPSSASAETFKQVVWAYEELTSAASHDGEWSEAAYGPVEKTPADWRREARVWVELERFRAEFADEDDEFSTIGLWLTRIVATSLLAGIMMYWLSAHEQRGGVGIALWRLVTEPFPLFAGASLLFAWLVLCVPAIQVEVEEWFSNVWIPFTSRAGLRGVSWFVICWSGGVLALSAIDLQDRGWQRWLGAPERTHDGVRFEGGPTKPVRRRARPAPTVRPKMIPSGMTVTLSSRMPWDH